MAMIDSKDDDAVVLNGDGDDVLLGYSINLLDLPHEDSQVNSEGLVHEQLMQKYMGYDFFQQDGSFCLSDPHSLVENLYSEQQSFQLNAPVSIDAVDADREKNFSFFSENAEGLNKLQYSHQPVHMQTDSSNDMSLFGYPMPNLPSWSNDSAQEDRSHSIGLDNFTGNPPFNNQQMLRNLPDCDATVGNVGQLGQLCSHIATDSNGKTVCKQTKSDDLYKSNIQELEVKAEDISSFFTLQNGRTDLSYMSGIANDICNASTTVVNYDCSMPSICSTDHKAELPGAVMNKNGTEIKQAVCNDDENYRIVAEGELLLEQDSCSSSQFDVTCEGHPPVILFPTQMIDFHETLSETPPEQNFRDDFSFMNTHSSFFPSSKNSSSVNIDRSVCQSYKRQKVLLKNALEDQMPAPCFSQHDYNGFSSNTMVNNPTRSSLSLDGDVEISILEDISGPACPPPPHQPVVSYPVQQQHGFPDYYQPGLGGITGRKVDERVTLQHALQDLSQPISEASPPEGTLSVPLLRHQRIALAWMIKKENNSHSKKGFSGGILADDQGLGKTVSTIALILHERSPSIKSCSGMVKQECFQVLSPDDDGKDCMSELDDMNHSYDASPFVINDSENKEDPVMVPESKPEAGTLIVCPTSVLRQWADEIQNKVTPKANLSYLVYHGSNRTKDPSELAKYDVVLTTYSIVSMEVLKKPSGDDDKEKLKHDASDMESPSKKKRKSSSSKRKGFKDGDAIESSKIESSINPVAGVSWFRLVLDEAQSIKNHKTQVAKACWGLRAKRRWCLSGTPIQNAVDDLYSYFRFLRYEPYDNYTTFCSSIKSLINRNSLNGYKKLQAVLKTTMLRRTKGSLIDGQPIIVLPPKTSTLKKVEFSQEERAIYSSLEAESQKQYMEYEAKGTVNKNYVNILLMLLRLRQACNHPSLVKLNGSDLVSRSSLEMAQKLPKATRQDLLNCLETSLSVCAICNGQPEDAVVTACRHVFCNQCICEHLAADDNICPRPCCKFLLNVSSVFSKDILIRSISLDLGEDNNSCDSSSCVLDPTSVLDLSTASENSLSSSSSKIKAAMEILLSLPKSDCSEKSNDGTCPQFENRSDSVSGSCSSNAHESENLCTSPVTEKAIVFSQWTSMLNLLEVPLKVSGIQYRRLDGTMSIAARDKAVKDFKMIPEVTVMIMSLKAASLGLNMTEACHVVLLDLWWNPTTEDQAVDRAHRIGQTRPVTVSRLTVKDTVEDRILALQEKKRKMVASAFGEDESGTRQTRLTVEDLNYLFMV